jgi:hypothetical protein
MATYHVMPENDLREHVMSADCWCHPAVDEEYENVLVHNSMDGREAFETGERKPS